MKARGEQLRTTLDEAHSLVLVGVSSDLLVRKSDKLSELAAAEEEKRKKEEEEKAKTSAQNGEEKKKEGGEGGEEGKSEEQKVKEAKEKEEKEKAQAKRKETLATMTARAAAKLLLEVGFDVCMRGLGAMPLSHSTTTHSLAHALSVLPHFPPAGMRARTLYSTGSFPFVALPWFTLVLLMMIGDWFIASPEGCFFVACAELLVGTNTHARMSMRCALVSVVPQTQRGERGVASRTRET